MIAAYTGAELPSGDSPELVLVQATPKERIESIRLNSEEWKGPLDLDSYLAREETLLKQQLTKKGLTCWILVDRREPEDGRTILSSCETYKKTAMVGRAGNVEDASAHGVGSVFCRAEFRGKGYAKRMLQELSKKIDTWMVESEGKEKSLFSILFSDIGKRFYAQFGWKAHPSSHFAMPSISKEEYSSQLTTLALPKVRDLRADDVQRCMCNTDVIEREREVLRRASLQCPGTKVAITPDFDHFLWHWAREEFYSHKLYPGRQTPSIKGAGNDDAKVYCAWNRTFGATPQENTLYILRWVYGDPTSPEETETVVKAMAAILRRAQEEGHDWNMASIEFWNPTPLLERAVVLLDPTAEIIHREKSSIASLRWSGNPEENVEWLCNEKYAWC
ncbi:hypothetical protein BJX61DRAFT_372198 [Aspergillus egyptiacus]|nr:hypothetical protein BJX61DRAFT_372198 [Aspergillus egyptiacus]